MTDLEKWVQIEDYLVKAQAIVVTLDTNYPSKWSQYVDETSCSDALLDLIDSTQNEMKRIREG